MNKNDKILIVLMADTSTHENQGRALHALLFAKQAHEAGSDVKLIFDGGGVEWAKQLPEHEKLSDLYQELKEEDIIGGACEFCSGAFGVKDELELADANLLDEADGHPNIGKRVANGWTPIIL
ncbi:MAG: DsrE family protein [Candidatus Paceibacterota bacterium]